MKCGNNQCCWAALLLVWLVLEWAWALSSTTSTEQCIYSNQKKWTHIWSVVQSPLWNSIIYCKLCVCVFSAFLPSAHLTSPASLAARASHPLVALTLGISHFVSAAGLLELCDVFRPALPLASSHPFFLVPASSSSTSLSVQVDSAVATCFQPRRFGLGLLYL